MLEASEVRRIFAEEYAAASSRIPDLPAEPPKLRVLRSVRLMGNFRFKSASLEIVDIGLSVYHADESGLRDTVKHEIAHLLAFLRHGGGHGHNHKWRQTARELGIQNPQRTCPTARVDERETFKRAVAVVACVKNESHFLRPYFRRCKVTTHPYLYACPKCEGPIAAVPTYRQVSERI